MEASRKWKNGISMGSVVGQLKKVDGLSATSTFVLVSEVGPSKIVCTFTDAMEEDIGQFLFKKVRVSGKIHYQDTSPFPQMVEVSDGGIEAIGERKGQPKLLELSGLFRARGQEEAGE